MNDSETAKALEDLRGPVLNAYKWKALADLLERLLERTGTPSPKGAAVIHFTVDGGKTWLESDQGIRVSIDIEREGEPAVELVFNFTEEGLIQDVNDAEAVLGTSAQMYDDIATNLMGLEKEDA